LWWNGGGGGGGEKLDRYLSLIMIKIFYEK
jgi:hypothetical protein